jgi:alcohol dehydrogenase
MTGLPTFGWRMPVDVVFGPGCVAQLPQRLGDDPVVLLVFEQARALGLQDRLRGLLGDGLQEMIECPDSLGTLSWARALSSRVWPLLAASPRAVLLAVGGGTVLDMAKLLRCRPLDGDFESLVRALRGQAPWPAMRAERMWLVPTTAGTGSEVTRWATVWDTEQPVARKRSLDEPFGYAECAFVDPELAASCPPGVTRDCALDALSHALEAMWNRHANPVSDALALTAARRIVAQLPRVLQRPDDMAARQALSLAALEAGLAFSQTRTALAHALSYPLTLEQGVPHGLACALWLPTAWRLAVGRDERLDALLAQVFSLPAAQGADALSRWLQALGVPLDLEAIGVVDAQARIDQALASERGRNFIAAVAD